MKELLLETLRSVLEYEPEVGEFRWRERRAIVRNHKVWNSRYAGKVAGTVNRKGYRIIGIDGGFYYAHRLAWFYVHGAWPHAEIDHANGVKDDNRLSNLREATQAENQRNRPRQRNNTSGIKGVQFDKRTGKWLAVIWADRKSNNLGLFATPKEAAAAYADAARRLHGRFARID